MRRFVKMGIVLFVVGIVGAFFLYQWYRGNSDSNIYIRQWLNTPENYPEYQSDAFAQCPDAPFILPTTGFIGLLWRDTSGPYNALRRHTGIDIFGAGEDGTVPIYAAYDGYLTRLDDWLSTVIIRHDDPLQEGRTIWTYYTHMASRDGQTSYVADDFPRGTSAVFVEQGTLLGYQGSYSGGASFAVAMHLHFSIVTSEADGSFTNEAILDNTLNPSRYLGIDVSADSAKHPVHYNCIG